MDYFGGNWEVARTFHGSGLLEFNCTFEDTYYFAVTSEKGQYIWQEEVNITKYWWELETKSRPITKFRNVTKSRTELEDTIEFHNRTVTKNVGLFTMLFRSS